MTRRVTVVSLLTALIAAFLAPAASAAPQYREYVSLGDSFVSGPFIPLQRLDPLSCFKSTQNYPSVLARRLNVESFTDISCGGAQTKDMAGVQSGFPGQPAPQFSALKPTTDLVTVSIGGNDIGFSDIILTCAGKSVLDPAGAPCKAHFGDSLAQRVDATAPKVAAVLAGIKQRSPNAQIVVVGYLRVLPPSGGCWPVVPISRGDVPYLDGVQQQLNGMLGAQAAASGATFVNPYDISLGRDTCAAPWDKWVEGIIPTSPAFPVHPNAKGMAAVGEQVAAVLAGTELATV
ncbi:SGNH/GDSL hydrolase family protein [Nocardia sp. NRRL S-836]|uniref:SGNH/GDSL hydrolase family protein n=1 Tax=Nocardia sp. NRRL S-836 TaxID=1519492 RepID=UPI0006ADDB62|nr:SGNH/GDSL hydrolase family protein [Nocardia sp. NRRL S-836]KOV77072.1 GDSL family lipase [Nocardia sp. NRRL S-836]